MPVEEGFPPQKVEGGKPCLEATCLWMQQGVPGTGTPGAQEVLDIVGRRQKRPQQLRAGMRGLSRTLRRAPPGSTPGPWEGRTWVRSGSCGVIWILLISIEIIKADR